MSVDTGVRGRFARLEYIEEEEEEEEVEVEEGDNNLDCWINDERDWGILIDRGDIFLIIIMVNMKKRVIWWGLDTIDSILIIIREIMRLY